MEEQAMAVAANLARRYMDGREDGLIDPRSVVKAALAGYLAGSGVPTDEAVSAAERLAARMLVSPVPASPMYHGMPWFVAGPVSGAPYYR
ncbi:MAG TPA: hypothetical protein VIL07_00680 [Symbiobacteriaceae bacterium]